MFKRTRNSENARTKLVSDKFKLQAISYGLKIDQYAATFQRPGFAPPGSNLPKKTAFPIAGTTVEFVSGNSRFSVATVAMFGALGLAGKKNTNYLVFTMPDGTQYMTTREQAASFEPKMRQWAMDFNNLSRSLSAAQHPGGGTA